MVEEASYESCMSETVRRDSCVAGGGQKCDVLFGMTLPRDAPLCVVMTLCADQVRHRATMRNMNLVIEIGSCLFRVANCQYILRNALNYVLFFSCYDRTALFPLLPIIHPTNFGG